MGGREKVLVCLTPRALHELYIETKPLDVETRQMGHRAECDLCGEMVDSNVSYRTEKESRATGAAGLMPTARQNGLPTTHKPVLAIQNAQPSNRSVTSVLSISSNRSRPNSTING